MEMTLIYTIIGFALAGYSVIANDSKNNKKHKIGK